MMAGLLRYHQGFQRLRQKVSDCVMSKGLKTGLLSRKFLQSLKSLLSLIPGLDDSEIVEYPCPSAGCHIDFAICRYVCLCPSNAKSFAHAKAARNHSCVWISDASCSIAIAKAQATCVKAKICTTVVGFLPSRMLARTSSPVDINEVLEIPSNSVVIAVSLICLNAVLVCWICASSTSEKVNTRLSESAQGDDGNLGCPYPLHFLADCGLLVTPSDVNRGGGEVISAGVAKGRKRASSFIHPVWLFPLSPAPGFLFSALVKLNEPVSVGEKLQEDWFVTLEYPESVKNDLVLASLSVGDISTVGESKPVAACADNTVVGSGFSSHGEGNCCCGMFLGSSNREHAFRDCAFMEAKDVSSRASLGELPFVFETNGTSQSSRESE